MKPRLVLDAWAILALLQKEEPAAAQVRQTIAESEAGNTELYISLINLGEVYYRIGRIRGKAEADETLSAIRRLPLTVVPASEEAVLAAAQLKMHYAISYADAFAAATTERLDAVLMTGDPELVQLADRMRLYRLERK